MFGNWRWRILAEGDGLWRNIFSSRYGSAAMSCNFGMRARSLKSPSPWWKRGFFARLQVEFLFRLVCRGLVLSGLGWQEDVLLGGYLVRSYPFG